MRENKKLLYNKLPTLKPMPKNEFLRLWKESLEKKQRK